MVTDMVQTETAKTVGSWSFSGLLQFEKCPYATKLARIDKIPRPDYDSDPNHPLTRGSAIHLQGEQYIRGEVPAEPIPKAYKGFVEDLRQYRALYEEGKVYVEQDWAYDKDWGVTGWFDPNCWARVKCDVVVHWDPENMTITDWKTGKKMGKEVAHTQQGQIYSIAAFLRFPELKRVTVEFCYNDEFDAGGQRSTDELTKGKRTTKHYTREAAMIFLPRWTERALRMTGCFDFRPKPNVSNCKYCDYGSITGTGDCIYAAEPL